MPKSSKKEQKTPPKQAIKYVLSLDGIDDWVELPPAAFPAGNAITCSFWAYGGDNLPNETSVISVLDANGNRVLNTHVPWANGNIYFDCGNNGGTYDRIEKLAQSSDYKGKWSHWAFTKDATKGEMKIYLNGQLWHSGVSKTLPISKASVVRLGWYITGACYPGKLAELQFWNLARTETEIQHDMSLALLGNELGLVSYWPLNDGSGNIAHDKTSAANHGTIQGSTQVGWVVSTLSLNPKKEEKMLPTSSKTKSSKTEQKKTSPSEKAVEVIKCSSSATGLEDYGFWCEQVKKERAAKTEPDPPFRRGRIWT